MDWQGWFSMALTVAALLAMVFTWLAPHLVMFGVLTVLSLSGILSAKEALIGFSNEGLITVAAMFVIAAGLYATGGIDLLVNRLLGHPKSVRSAMFRVLFRSSA